MIQRAVVIEQSGNTGTDSAKILGEILGQAVVGGSTKMSKVLGGTLGDTLQLATLDVVKLVKFWVKYWDG